MQLHKNILFMWDSISYLGDFNINTFWLYPGPWKTLWFLSDFKKMGKKSQNKDQNSSLSFGWFVWPSESCHAGKVIAVQLVYACMLPVETGLVSRKNCYQYKKCTNKTTMNSNNPPIIASIEYLLPILTEHSSLIKLCATYIYHLSCG